MKNKKRYKGVRYIAKALQKYQKSQYKTYKDASVKAREILKVLKNGKQKVTIKNIFNLTPKTKTAKSGAPQIPSKLLELSYYFELIEYPDYISLTTNKVFFISEVSPKGVSDIEGGSRPDYNDYFADYVAFINDLKAMTKSEDKRYETEWMVTCTEPTKGTGKNKGKWISKIISVDGSGDKFDYGFNPNNPTKTPKTLVLSEPEAKSEQTPEQTTEKALETKKTPEGKAVEQNTERVKEIRGLIADLRQDAKDGLITKEFYQSEVAKLTSKLEEGGNI